jgi:hypothetical protein
MSRIGDLDGGSVINNAKHWRMRSEEIRTLVDDAQDPGVKAMMLRIAADYDRLAKWADDRERFERGRMTTPNKDLTIDNRPQSPNN